MDLIKWEAPQEGAYTLHPNWPKRLVWAWWNVIRNPWISSWIPSLEKPITVYSKPNIFAEWYQIYPGLGQSNVPTFNLMGYRFLKLVDKNSVTRYFASYRGRFIEYYIGWKPTGSFGIALRHANAKPITGPHI